MIEWKMHCHMNMETEHSILYRGKYKGKDVQWEVHTPRNKASGKFGKSKKYFFIDNDKREFRSEEELINAIESL